MGGQAAPVVSDARISVDSVIDKHTQADHSGSAARFDGHTRSLTTHGLWTSREGPAIQTSRRPVSDSAQSCWHGVCVLPHRCRHCGRQRRLHG
jgi:hypothetical protein